MALPCRIRALLVIGISASCIGFCCASDDQHRDTSSSLIRNSTTYSVPSKGYKPPKPSTTDSMMDGNGSSSSSSSFSSSSSSSSAFSSSSSSFSPSALGGSNAYTGAGRASPWSSAQNSSSKIQSAASRDSSKRNVSDGIVRRTSGVISTVIGNLLLCFIFTIIAGSLFAMSVYFFHRWRENMGSGRYPQVVYSMLRQSEDEPEDVLGEILINIGLAGPEDRSRSSESSSSSEPSDHELLVFSNPANRTKSKQTSCWQVDASELDGDNFTSIPLKRDEDCCSALVTNTAEESDEELLQ
ncbi:uncharacterized protein LOC143020296 isoform X2 [Oratosquilla oratoria]|uniref:uncharacterized protein LOC143020296 isoform X2 n=1 Tax=Oratosquilla oratoria TaxID=337810 RepID=UPI003F75929A